MKQTPIEWLEMKISEGLADVETIQKAKEMEKEQMEKLKDFDTWKEWKDL